jgi:hypothetical protein
MVSVPVNQFNIDRYSTSTSARAQSSDDLFDGDPEPVPQTSLIPALPVLPETTPSA